MCISIAMRKVCVILVTVLRYKYQSKYNSILVQQYVYKVHNIRCTLDINELFLLRHFYVYITNDFFQHFRFLLDLFSIKFLSELLIFYPPLQSIITRRGFCQIKLEQPSMYHIVTVIVSTFCRHHIMHDRTSDCSMVSLKKKNNKSKEAGL